MALSIAAMHARILAIGDELLFGRTVDTNSAWLARRLTDLGFTVTGVDVRGDDHPRLVAALRAGIADAELVLCTGGLGPTEDDRTRQVLAEALDVPLVEHPAAWRQICGWYRRHRPDAVVPASNRRQALVPRGAHLLANDRGTAPGILARGPRGLIACLPGVPFEMRAMMERLERRLPARFPALAMPTIGEVWFAGIGESAAQERIPGLLPERDPQSGITVSDLGHITLRAVGRPAPVRRLMAAWRRALRPHLLPRPGLAASLVERLTRRRRTIAVAESCTCGYVAAQLGAVPGASAVLREGCIAYDVAVKIARLGVEPALIRRHGVVSEAVAAAMAVGMRRLAGTDLAVATTGIAGPTGGTREVPVGTVCCAVADAHGTWTTTARLGGDRERVQRRAASQAILYAWQVETGAIATGVDMNP
jgi:nicotinamide-nucleotide amidase